MTPGKGNRNDTALHHLVQLLYMFFIFSVNSANATVIEATTLAELKSAGWEITGSDPTTFTKPSDHNPALSPLDGSVSSKQVWRATSPTIFKFGNFENDICNIKNVKVHVTLFAHNAVVQVYPWQSETVRQFYYPAPPDGISWVKDTIQMLPETDIVIKVDVLPGGFVLFDRINVEYDGVDCQSTTSITTTEGPTSTDTPTTEERPTQEASVEEGTHSDYDTSPTTQVSDESSTLMPTSATPDTFTESFEPSGEPGDTSTPLTGTTETDPFSSTATSDPITADTSDSTFTSETSDSTFNSDPTTAETSDSTFTSDPTTADTSDTTVTSDSTTEESSDSTATSYPTTEESLEPTTTCVVLTTEESLDSTSTSFPTVTEEPTTSFPGCSSTPQPETCCDSCTDRKHYHEHHHYIHFSFESATKFHDH